MYKKFWIPSRTSICYEYIDNKSIFNIYGFFGSLHVEISSLDNIGNAFFKLKKNTNNALLYHHNFFKNIFWFNTFKKHVPISKRKKDNNLIRSFFTFFKLIQNAIYGVSKGYLSILTFKGIGYKIKTNLPLFRRNLFTKVHDISKKKLNKTSKAKVKRLYTLINLGYRFSLIHKIPPNICLLSLKSTKVIVYGIEKQAVSQTGMYFRSFRPPEPYKGKGIKFLTELPKRKEGKKK